MSHTAEASQWVRVLTPKLLSSVNISYLTGTRRSVFSTRDGGYYEQAQAMTSGSQKPMQSGQDDHYKLIEK